MSEYTTGNAPGFQAAVDAAESEVLWSGGRGRTRSRRRKSRW